LAAHLAERQKSSMYGGFNIKIFIVNADRFCHSYSAIPFQPNFLLISNRDSQHQQCNATGNCNKKNAQAFFGRWPTAQEMSSSRPCHPSVFF
jgi:hypothetical protein